MPDDPKPEGQQATSGAPAAPSPESGAKPEDDGYDPLWMTKFTPRHKADLEAFSLTLPVYKERDELKNDIQRRQKWGNFTRDEVESLMSNERALEEYKAIATDLGVATKEDLELAQTPRELRLLLLGRKAITNAAQKGSKDNEENPFFSQLDAWAKVRGLVPSAPAPKNPADARLPSTTPGGTRVAGQKTHAELADGVWDPKAVEAELKRLGVNT